MTDLPAETPPKALSGPGALRGRTLFARIVREPMVQFMAAGAALFALNMAINGRTPPPADVVVISEGRIQQLAESFRLLSNRPPGRAELEAMVDDFVREEIAYREAVALGLDADDTVVRRRMRQKLEFLLEDMDAVADPSEADLERWLADHPDRYLIPERRALRQVLASADKRGAAARDDARRFREQLAAGADAEGLGDPSLLPAVMPLTSGEGVASLFGREFADAVFAAGDAGGGDIGWIGPVGSAFGQHAVLILEREPARQPALDEVRDRVGADWIEARRLDQRAVRDKALRSRYRIRIEWPDAQMADPAPPQ